MLDTELEMAAAVCVWSFEDTGIAVQCILTQ